MGFAESYLKLREKRTRSETRTAAREAVTPRAASADAAGSSSGGFAAQYLQLREKRGSEPPRLSLPEIPAAFTASGRTQSVQTQKPQETTHDSATAPSRAGTFGGGAVRESAAGFTGNRTRGGLGQGILDILAQTAYSGDSSLPLNTATQAIGGIRNNPEAVEKALAGRDALEAKRLERAAQTAEWAGKNKLKASAASVLTSPLSSADFLQRLVEMNAIGQTLPRENLTPGEVTQALRGGASRDMGAVGKFFYDTGMSGVDSLAASWLGGGVSGVGGTILAGGAAASAANDIRERGGSDEQALVGGAVSGLFESLFETLSIGQLDALKEAPVDGARTLLKNLAKSTLTNASEEAATELANTVFDTLYMKELSGYTENVKAAMAAGMSEREARNYAMKIAAGEIGLSALSGGLMGAGMGAAGSAVGALNGRQANTRLSGQGTGQKGQGTAEAVQGRHQAEAGLKSPENSVTETAVPAPSRYTGMMTGRLIRMGEAPETAARLGDLLARVADGGEVSAVELAEIRQNPTAAQMEEAARMLAARNGGIQNGTGQETTDNVSLLDGRGDRGTGPDPAGQAGAVQSLQAGQEAQGQRGGQGPDAGIAEEAIRAQNLKAIERADAVRESGAKPVSTREYLGLDIGSDRPCLLEAPEEIIRSDRVLSEVYDEIWEMGYKPHLFTGKPETADDSFDFNGAVRGDEVYVRIDHTRYDADAIWKHERYHIMSQEDAGLRTATRDALLEQYGEAELREKLGTYWEKYAGAYGLQGLQGDYELSDSELLTVLEELLADAYAGKDTFRTGAVTYQDTVRDMASQREGQAYQSRGPPAERYSIQHTADGKKYVQADRQVITGQDPEVWAEQVEDYINYKIRKGEDVALLTEDGDTLLLTRDTAGKAKHAFRPDGSRMTDREYEARLNAESHIDELAQVSRRQSSKLDVDGLHGDFASRGWQYRTAYFRDFDGKYYRIDISVAQSDRGNVVYHVGNMKERSFPNVSGSSAKGGARKVGKASSPDTIPQGGPDVKGQERNFPTINGSSAKGGAQRGGEASSRGTIPQPAQDVKGLSLPELPVQPPSRDPNGLSLPELPDQDSFRFSADEDQKPVPAERRRAAVRKLADDLAALFPETSKSYLRNLADEIRSGADAAHLDALFQEAYDSAKVYDETPEAGELREIAHELRGRRVYADPSLKAEFGDDWNTMRRFFFGKSLYFTNDRSDGGLDQLNAELAGRFGGRFDENETDMGGVIARLEYVLRNAANKQLTLDQQARQYGGEEAAGRFRDSYRQRFMDAVEGYRDTLRGLDQAQRQAREAERQRRRQELDDYVAQARQILRDRASRSMDTGKTRPAGMPPEGMDIDTYVRELEQRAAQAREERLRTVNREDFHGSEAMEKLGIRITGSVTDQYRNAGQLRQRQEAARQARQAIRRAEKRLNASEAEKNFASGIASGIYTEKDIPKTMDGERVMELADYYMGERAFGLDMLRQQKADISRAQQEKARAILGPALAASEEKEHLTGRLGAVLGDAFMLNNRTAERNMRTLFGDEAGERINQWLFTPVAENEGERYRFVNRMMDQVRKIKCGDGKERALTKGEGALVQKVIEGRAAEEIAAGMETGAAIRSAAENLRNGQAMEDAAREFRLDEEGRKLARQYAVWLEAQEELEKADTVKIENAVKLYSDLYGQFYEAINDFLTVHGYEPVGFIKGYAPHMQSEDSLGRVRRAFQELGVGADTGALPTSIAGRTKDFKPGKRWNPHFQTRTGENTDYDIVGGFEQYVDYLSDVLYHTDDIARIREANKFLRQTYAPEEIRQNLSRAENLKYRTPEEKRAFLIDQGALDGSSSLSAADLDRKMSEYADRLYESVQNTTKYGQLAVWMDDYANKLAGKQLFADRDMERTFGRMSLNLGNKLNRLFTRAQVAGNLSSVLNQTSQLPIIQSELGTKYTLQALRDNWNGRLRRGDWAQGSDFLTEKNGLNYIATSPSEMITGALFQPLDFVDGYLSTLAVRGKYLQEIDRGKSHEEAMRSADRFGREVMGSRAKGSAPLAFQEKSIFSRMLHTFQLEALNTWEHLSQDLPRDFREIARTQGKSKAARAAAGLAVKILLGNFLLNRTAEFLYGGTPAQGDVLGIAANFVASGLGITVNAMLKAFLNAGWEKIAGEKLFDDEDGERPFDLGEGLKAAGSDMLNDAPLVQNLGALFGIGDLSLPMPDIGQGVQRTADAWQEDGGFSWEVARQLMGLAGDVVPGGRQAEKTFQGLDTAIRGGRYSGYGDDAKLMYPVDTSPFNSVRAALFGTSALEETGDYYASGEKPLSAKQTQLYRKLTANGADKQEVYNVILDWRKISGDGELDSTEKARLCEDAVSGTELPDRQKLELYRGLTGAESRAEKLSALLDAGIDWDKAIAAYAQYDEIQDREGRTAAQKAAELARWADQNFPRKQAGAVKEQFRYYSMVPAEAGQYGKLTGAGLDSGDAYRLSEVLSRLEPEAGKQQVSALQRARAVVGSGLGEDVQLAALGAVLSESEYRKVQAGYEQGVSPEQYVQAKEAIAAADDGNGNVSQEEAKKAIKGLDGLSNEQKAALWQVQNKSWKAENNPFSTKVGRKVRQAMEDDALEGLTLPELPG